MYKVVNVLADYEQLLNLLRDGEDLFTYYLDAYSQELVSKAIASGDALRGGGYIISASPRLLARFQAEEAHALINAETSHNHEIEQASAALATDQDCEPVQVKRPSPRVFAAEWLRELLQEPRWVEDILQLATENKIAFTTLKRAKKIIGAKSVKIGGYFGGEDTRWFWRLR